MALGRVDGEEGASLNAVSRDFQFFRVPRFGRELNGEIFSVLVDRQTFPFW